MQRRIDHLKREPKKVCFLAYIYNLYPKSFEYFLNVLNEHNQHIKNNK